MSASALERSIQLAEIGLLAVDTYALFSQVQDWMISAGTYYQEDAPMWKDYRASERAKNEAIKQFIALQQPYKGEL